MTKTKRLLVTAILMAMPLCAGAQLSELIEFPSPSTYKAIKTIVRNFNEYYDVIAVYGYDTMSIYTDTIEARTMVYKRKIATGEVTRICTLNGGYCVNDFRFVRLKKFGSAGVEDYCCFCGTHSEWQFEWIFTPYDEPSQFVIDTINKGFAGFFSMDDALWENPGSTVKVRDIEWTEELYRLTCYAEQFGEHWDEQETFRDNAVMDIIGKPLANVTGGARSSLSRVKFYPIFPGGNNGTRWEVDIRFSDTNQISEIMLDVAGTKDFTVTASQFEDDYKRLILRYSRKEDVLYANGLELSGSIYYINMPALQNDNPAAIFELPVRLCATKPSNEFAVAFGYPRVLPGIYTLQFNAVNPGLPCLRGIFNSGNMQLKDLAYLPLSKRTATLARSSLYSTESMICINEYPNNNILSSIFLYEWSLNLQSLVGHQEGSDDRLSFGGVYAAHPCPAEIGSQIVPPSYNNLNSCLSNVNGSKMWSCPEAPYSELEFKIKRRFNDDNPVTTKHFSILKDKQKVICTKK